MNRITNEQREAIVRNAVAERDANLAGEPRKLWLWKNFVDGKPEYWAFDNPYPINLTDGDPQTLGEPCGYALVKPSRQGRTDVSEKQVPRAIARAPEEGNLEAATLRGELDRAELMLRRVTQALGDLSFECFGGIGTSAPSVETYNRTFGVLEEARAHGVEGRKP